MQCFERGRENIGRALRQIAKMLAEFGITSRPREAPLSGYTCSTDIGDVSGKTAAPLKKLRTSTAAGTLIKGTCMACLGYPGCRIEPCGFCGGNQAPDADRKPEDVK